MTLSVVIITHNEEANLARTLESVRPLVADGKGEIIVVDSGSTDRTVEIAKSFGAKVFVEEWKGYAAQKNSAIDKAPENVWILSLDADEEVEPELAQELLYVLMPTIPQTMGERVQQLKYLYGRQLRKQMHAVRKKHGNPDGFFVPITAYSMKRKNYFLGRWIKRGGFWPDPKLRLFRKGTALFEDRPVHEDAKLTSGISGRLKHALIHHSYPTLSDYIDHMNRYSSLGAEMVVAKSSGKVRFSAINIVLRPLTTFVYNYFFRLGFLDGREGLLLHLYHAVYVSWKYAKAWELSRNSSSLSS